MWSTYIVSCADNTLYTGVTTDLDRRVHEHNHSLLGAKYTKARRPVALVRSQNFGSRQEATAKERRIKKMNKQKKMLLIGLSDFTERKGR